MCRSGGSSASFDGGKLQEAHVESARLALELDSSVEAPTAPDPPKVDGHKHAGKAPIAPEPFRPLVELPDLHVLRALIQNTARQAAAPHTPEGMRVTLDSLTVELTRGAEKLELGPGKVGLERKAHDLTLDFSAGSEKTPNPADTRRYGPHRCGR